MTCVEWLVYFCGSYELLYLRDCQNSEFH